MPSVALPTMSGTLLPGGAMATNSGATIAPVIMVPVFCAIAMPETRVWAGNNSGKYAGNTPL